jgi:hypothetical protein
MRCERARAVTGSGHGLTAAPCRSQAVLALAAYTIAAATNDAQARLVAIAVPLLLQQCVAAAAGARWRMDEVARAASPRAPRSAHGPGRHRNSSSPPSCPAGLAKAAGVKGAIALTHLAFMRALSLFRVQPAACATGPVRAERRAHASLLADASRQSRAVRSTHAFRRTFAPQHVVRCAARAARAPSAARLRRTLLCGCHHNCSSSPWLLLRFSVRGSRAKRTCESDPTLGSRRVRRRDGHHQAFGPARSPGRVRATPWCCSFAEEVCEGAPLTITRRTALRTACTSRR